MRTHYSELVKQQKAKASKCGSDLSSFMVDLFETKELMFSFTCSFIKGLFTCFKTDINSPAGCLVKEICKNTEDFWNLLNTYELGDNFCFFDYTCAELTDDQGINGAYYFDEYARAFGIMFCNSVSRDLAYMHFVLDDLGQCPPNPFSRAKYFSEIIVNPIAFGLCHEYSKKSGMSFDLQDLVNLQKQHGSYEGSKYFLNMLENYGVDYKVSILTYMLGFLRADVDYHLGNYDYKSWLDLEMYLLIVRAAYVTKATSKVAFIPFIPDTEAYDYQTIYTTLFNSVKERGYIDFLRSDKETNEGEFNGVVRTYYKKFVN